MLTNDTVQLLLCGQTIHDETLSEIHVLSKPLYVYVEEVDIA